MARLNDMYWQFARIGNNYNQIVRQVNSHFSEQQIPRQLGALIHCTRELKALSEQILKLSHEARERWLHE